jgi:hypothetical protein
LRAKEQVKKEERHVMPVAVLDGVTLEMGWEECGRGVENYEDIKLNFT